MREQILLKFNNLKQYIIIHRGRNLSAEKIFLVSYNIYYTCDENFFFFNLTKYSFS